MSYVPKVMKPISGVILYDRTAKTDSQLVRAVTTIGAPNVDSVCKNADENLQFLNFELVQSRWVDRGFGRAIPDGGWNWL